MLEKYQKTSTNDKTAIILGELLQVLPPDGQKNLTRDIVGRQDGALVTLATEIKAFLLSQCMRHLLENDQDQV